ncbi:unnamed protein product [Somion occarium]
MSMQRCFYYIKPRYKALNNRRCPNFPHRLHSTTKSPVDTDAHGIPVRPTWSVNQLLTSYPKPTISPSTLERLHVLSALVPPAEGTEEHKQLSAEMENLVKLVEAVKLVDTSGVDKTRLSKSESVPDGRIWAEGTGIDLSGEVSVSETESPSGRVLLNHAARTENGMYVVDTDRRKK